ncbi:unnamed protein product [Adineta steineri]|uniref:Secreted protein n=1 Tax=Adineta steineri TaxID=433720 RepID=A0A814M1Y0_9BILA|nr:unnamed protein product [Adineta steineri]CAF3511260.1 unnamed protein product [Adineta steineri]
MQLETNGLILILFGCFIRTSFELACIQCTSPIRRVAQNWDHSCLDGTLAPEPCEQPINDTRGTFINCASALFKVGLNGNRGKEFIILLIKKKEKEK